MAKDKKKSKKQNKVEAKPISAPLFTEEQMQHLIARAIVEAEEMRKEVQHEQKKTEREEWRAAIGYKEFRSKSALWRRIQTGWNSFLCFIKIFFVPAEKIKGDRAMVALMRVLLKMSMVLAQWAMLFAGILCVAHGIGMFFWQEISLKWVISNLFEIVWGVPFFALAGFFRIASIEVEKIDDRNYLFGFFAVVTSIVSIVLAVVSVI